MCGDFLWCSSAWCMFFVFVWCVLNLCVFLCLCDVFICVWFCVYV